MSIAFKIYIHFIRNTLIKSIVYPRYSNAESTKKERERESNVIKIIIVHNKISPFMKICSCAIKFADN